MFRKSGLPRRFSLPPFLSACVPFLLPPPLRAYYPLPRVLGRSLRLFTFSLTEPNRRNIRRIGGRGITTVTMAVKYLFGLIVYARNPAVRSPSAIYHELIIYARHHICPCRGPCPRFYRQLLRAAGLHPYLHSRLEDLPTPQQATVACRRAPSVCFIPMDAPCPRLHSPKGPTHFSTTNRFLPPRSSWFLHRREGDIPIYLQATFSCHCPPPGCRPR